MFFIAKMTFKEYPAPIFLNVAKDKIFFNCILENFPNAK